MTAPIVVGGNGHSGTRIFAEILTHCGVYMGVAGISYDRRSKDLHIKRLMTAWIKPYLLGLNESDTKRMQRVFRTRLRLLIPYRGGSWGFKNPRSMFLLPFYNELFPNMKFIHVIRDGRDMCFGNPFVDSPTLWSYVSEEEIENLTREERMMRFWGEANLRTKKFGESQMSGRYLRVRFEDLCHNTESEMGRIVRFAEGPDEAVRNLVGLVKTPKSIGRWQSFDRELTRKACDLGERYLAEFGYL